MQTQVSATYVTSTLVKHGGSGAALWAGHTVGKIGQAIYKLGNESRDGVIFLATAGR